MPHIIVKLWPGRTEETKAKFTEQIVKECVDILKPGKGEDAVSVSFEEVKQEDWAQAVYKPDIEGKWDTLYKKPGYKL